MLTKPTRTRKYVHRSIKIRSAKSYNSLRRLNFALRGHQIDHLPHVKFENGGRWYAIFEGYSLTPEARARCENNLFKVV